MQQRDPCSFPILEAVLLLAMLDSAETRVSLGRRSGGRLSDMASGWWCDMTSGEEIGERVGLDAHVGKEPRRKITLRA